MISTSYTCLCTIHTIQMGLNGTCYKVEWNDHQANHDDDQILARFWTLLKHASSNHNVITMVHDGSRRLTMGHDGSWQFTTHIYIRVNFVQYGPSYWWEDKTHLLPYRGDVSQFLDESVTEFESQTFCEGFGSCTGLRGSNKQSWCVIAIVVVVQNVYNGHDPVCMTSPLLVHNERHQPLCHFSFFRSTTSLL